MRVWMTHNSDKMFLIYYCQVILPTLHISLGVFKKLFDLLEKECHSMDVELLHLRVRTEDSAGRTNFDDQVVAERERQDNVKQILEEKRNDLERAEEELPLHVLQNTREEMDEAFRDVAEIVFKLRT